MNSSDRLLAGRVALVTGAGRGCGAAVALALAAAGAKVCASDLNPDRADHVADGILAAGGEAFGAQADVSNKFQVGSLIETLRDRYGRIDILVQNAHVSPHAPLLTMDEWEWRRTLEVNLTGAFFCAQLAGRVMADEGGGAIVLLVEPAPALVGDGGPLAASQAGLKWLAGALRHEIESQGVRVAAIETGNPEDVVARILDFLQPEVRA